jgi:hypothetical protein
MGSGFDSSLPCVLCSIPHSPSLVKPAISSAKSSSVASQRPFSLHCARELVSTQPLASVRPPERVSGTCPCAMSDHTKPNSPLDQVGARSSSTPGLQSSTFLLYSETSLSELATTGEQSSGEDATQSGPVEERRHPVDQTRRKAIVLLLRQRSTTHERTGDAAPGRHDRRHDSRR